MLFSLWTLEQAASACLLLWPYLTAFLCLWVAGSFASGLLVAHSLRYGPYVGSAGLRLAGLAHLAAWERTHLARCRSR